jgi:hypothetical protein
MTTLSLERLSPSSRRGNGDESSTTRLVQFVAKQTNTLRTSFSAAAAYDKAQTPAARRAVLDRFAAQIGR